MNSYKLYDIYSDIKENQKYNKKPDKKTNTHCKNTNKAKSCPTYGVKYSLQEDATWQKEIASTRGKIVKYLITLSEEQSPYTEQELPRTQHSIGP